MSAGFGFFGIFALASSARLVLSGMQPAPSNSGMAEVANVTNGGAPSDGWSVAADERRLVPGMTLSATTVPTDDFDLDGLNDAQEMILGTLPYLADSDGDGFIDSEEVARHTDPMDSSSIPTNADPAGGLLAHGRDDGLRLVLVVHESAGQQGDALLRVGLLAGGEVRSVQLSRLLAFGEVSEVAASNGSTVTTIDIPISPSLVHTFGEISFFMASGSVTTQTLTSAAKLDLISNGTHLFQQSTVYARDAMNQGRNGGPTIRKPIPLDPEGPAEATFIAGAVCYQRSEVVAVNGSRMLHQIVEADCVPGWDTFCSSDCAAALGTTYETIDPWALIGG